MQRFYEVYIGLISPGYNVLLGLIFAFYQTLISQSICKMTSVKITPANQKAPRHQTRNSSLSIYMNEKL